MEYVIGIITQESTHGAGHDATVTGHGEMAKRSQVRNECHAQHREQLGCPRRSAGPVTRLRRNLQDVAGLGWPAASLGRVRCACNGGAEWIHVPTARWEGRENDVLRSCWWGPGGNCLAGEIAGIPLDSDNLMEAMRALRDRYLIRL